MNNELKSIKKRKRKLEIINLLVWVIGIPLVAFIGALIGWMNVENISASPLRPLLYLLIFIFICFGLVWNFMWGKIELKIIMRYFNQKETQEDIETAKNLKYVTLMYLLFFVLLIQFFMSKL